MKMWSRHLVPKPKDWGDHIDIVGFFFDDIEDDDGVGIPDSTTKRTGTTGFIPPQELQSFLSNGSPAIFVGFGSMVVEDASSLVQVSCYCTFQA